MKIELPIDVEYILNAFEEKGFEAYIVGGCVRDIIIGKVPKDWDVVTSAKVLDIQNIFPKTIDVGIKHGTLVLPIKGVNYEITTFKVDEGKQGDIFQDLARRDLTINAIAYSPRAGLIDPFKGRDDIGNRIIRGVESSDDRFVEDPLRMLRAIRFTAQLGFDIEKYTLESIKKNAQKISSVSTERIREELTKLIYCMPKKLLLAYETGILKHILPEFDLCVGVEQKHPYHVHDVAGHIIASMEALDKKDENDFILLWTMLFHDIGKPIAKVVGGDGYDHFYGHQEISSKIANVVMSRLKFDNDSINKITTLVEYHDRTIHGEKTVLRKILSEIGKELLILLIKVQRADALAQNIKYSKERTENTDKLIALIEEIEENKECFSLKDLAVTGDDLIDLGLKPSKLIGSVLSELLELVIELPKKNNKEELIIEAIRIIKKYQG